MPKGKAPQVDYIKLGKKPGELYCMGKKIDLMTLVEIANVSIRNYAAQNYGELPFRLVDDEE